MSNQKRDNIGLIGLIVAILALVGSFMVPEVRTFFRFGQETSKEALKEEAEKLLMEFIGNWEKQNLSGLEDLLSEDFYYTDQKDKYQNKKEFIDEKRDIFNRKDWITIKIDKMAINLDNGLSTGTIIYKQTYETQGYSSVGLNELSIKRIDGKYRICKEKFERYN